jgi:hypothetical protein
MLRKAPTLKIARSSPRNSLFIGHASNPPEVLKYNYINQIWAQNNPYLFNGIMYVSENIWVKLKIKWPGRLEKTQI